MTVREMHIEVQQATQNVGSNKRRKFQPDEIDWILNKVMHRYIETEAMSVRNEPSAEHSLTRLQHLAPLLRDIALPCFKRDGGVLARIPLTVQELLSVSADVQPLCGTAPSTLRQARVVYKLPLVENLTQDDPPYFDVLRLSVNNVDIFNAESFAELRSAQFEGYPRRWLWQPLRLMLPELEGLIYWEHYNGQFYPNTLIFDGYGAANITLVSGSTTYVAVPMTEFQTEYVAKMPMKRPVRLFYQTELPDMQVGAFTRTHYTSPLGYLQSNTLKIDTDGSFIVGGCTVHYVKKPRAIDVNLNVDCDLHVSAHQNICDLATEYIKNLREDPNWEAKLQDNMRRTTI